MLKFTIQKSYDIDDTEFNGDLMEARLLGEVGNIIMSGDYYHNKIEDRIEGFFKALDYLEIEYHIDRENINEIW